MRAIETTVYTFAELSDEAKERAREWYRSCMDSDCYWHEFIYEDANTIAEIIGIQIDTVSVTLMDGSKRYKPAISFSGFYSQGDGACFTGRYAYAKGSCKAIRSYAPQDAELHRIADWLCAIQKRHFYMLNSRIAQSGNYCHARTMSVETLWEYSSDGYPSIDTQDEVEQLIRDFVDWIYKQLQSEYEYQNSDEAIDEAIECNGYEFNDQGEIV